MIFHIDFASPCLLLTFNFRLQFPSSKSPLSSSPSMCYLHYQCLSGLFIFHCTLYSTINPNPLLFHLYLIPYSIAALPCLIQRENGKKGKIKPLQLHKEQHSVTVHEFLNKEETLNQNKYLNNINKQ